MMTGLCMPGDGVVLFASELSTFRIVPQNWKIFEPDPDSDADRDVSFEILMENPSLVHKQEVALPLNVSITDEFGNAYLDQQLADPKSGSEAVMSLYPGEMKVFPFRFQAPVAAARQLVVEVYDQKNTFCGRTVVLTDSVSGLTGLSGLPELSADDLIIIYPDTSFVVAPGEIIFLKLGFSERAGWPHNIHIISRDYVFRDEGASGQYELQVPPFDADKDFEVVVMAQWGEYPYEKVVSRILQFEIKG